LCLLLTFAKQISRVKMLHFYAFNSGIVYAVPSIETRRNATALGIATPPAVGAAASRENVVTNDSVDVLLTLIDN
jgi:hypothetical protein